MKQKIDLYWCAIVLRYIATNGGYTPGWAAAPGIRDTLPGLIRSRKVKVTRRTALFIHAEVAK